MMRHLFRLKDDQSGSAMVEMAMVAPIFVALMVAVMQFGIAMRDYNSLRSATADVARFAVVNFEASNRLTDEQLKSYARTVATKAPYSLANARLTVEVTTPSTSRIAGSIEKQIDYCYDLDWIIEFGAGSRTRTCFSRPVFLFQGK